MANVESYRPSLVELEHSYNSKEKHQPFSFFFGRNKHQPKCHNK